MATPSMNHDEIEMEEQELKLETELSKRPSLELNDTTALTNEQQQALDQHKIKTRIENELYLRKHPEVTVMLSSFVSDVLLKKPEKIREHAAVFFTNPSLPNQVKAKLEAKSDQTTMIQTNY